MASDLFQDLSAVSPEVTTLVIRTFDAVEDGEYVNHPPRELVLLPLDYVSFGALTKIVITHPDFIGYLQYLTPHRAPKIEHIALRCCLASTRHRMGVPSLLAYLDVCIYHQSCTFTLFGPRDIEDDIWIPRLRQTVWTLIDSRDVS